MEDRKYFLGIDLGTSAMKFVLINGRKEVLAQLTENYDIAKPEKDWNEIDPEIWYQCMVRGMKKIFQTEDPARLKGVGVTGQMHTLIPMGADGKPVRPAIMWNDMRTRALIPELRTVFRSFADGEYLAKTVSTGSPAAGLYWMKKEEPELFSSIKKFLIGPDYLVYRLTGAYTTDYCEASTSCLYNIEERRWSAEVQDFLGLPDCVYPEIGGSSETAGWVKKELAEELGIGEKVFVLFGTGDNPATAISTGCLGRGYPVISLGTSGILMMPFAAVDSGAKGKRILLSLEKGSFQYLVQGAVQSTGNTLDWWVKNISGETDYKSIDALNLSGGPQAGTVMFYPHLMGEKTMYGDPSLRGAFLDLGVETGKGNMLYAVLEGLSMGFRELAEKMRVPLEQFESVKVVGGGAHSDTWMQILANVLHKKVERLEGVISPGYGIALLAAFRGGCISELQEIASGLVTVEKQFEPDKNIEKVLDVRYEKYCRIHTAMQYLNAE